MTTAHEELNFATGGVRKVPTKTSQLMSGDGGMKVTPAKLKRAKSRDVKQINAHTWRVGGLADEVKPMYLVRWDGERFFCTCHTERHGDTRARTGCTHDLAVRLTKPQLERGGADAVTQHEVEEGDVTEQGVMDTPSSTYPSHLPSLTLEDPRWFQHDNRGFPHWLTELRPHQSDAIQKVEDRFANGADVVFMEAPTGSGKTVIGELTRRLYGAGVYVCSGIELQTQFARDFQYASSIKGRANYPTLMPGSWPEITAADCDREGGDSCTWCGNEVFNCPYTVAKEAAERNPLAAINTTYGLYVWNYTMTGLGGRPIVIVDEADMLESEVMGFVEFNISPKMVRELGLTVPKKGARSETIEAWLRDEVLDVAKAYLARVKSRPKSKDTIRSVKTYASLVGDLKRIIDAGVVLGEGDEGKAGWVRVYENKKGQGEEDRFTLKPVKVSEFAGRYLWGHGVRWLLMSATLVSVDELVDSLGVDQWEIEEPDPDMPEDHPAWPGGNRRPARWGEVHVPAVFPVENRQIVASGIADMTRKGQEKGGMQDLLDGIKVVVDAHVDDNMLIHTHTYATAKTVEAWVRKITNRPVWSYSDSRTREAGLQNFKDHGGILVAPSMDRGIDLPGDLCRVQVICKLPMPYLGDAQVSARMKTRGGELWYSAQAARGLIQMTGRATRSETDWSTCYILDSTFGKWKRRNKALLPGWWQEAVTYVPPTRFADEVAKRSQQHQQRKVSQ